jgi:hypothetical protein
VRYRHIRSHTCSNEENEIYVSKNMAFLTENIAGKKFGRIIKIVSSLYLKIKEIVPCQSPHGEYITVGCVGYAARAVKYPSNALLGPISGIQLR